MWFTRRIMRIPWAERRTNQEVLQMAGTTRELMTIVKRRQFGYLGHVLKGDGPRETLLGMIERKRARGRQKMMYMDGIKEMVGKRR